MEIPQLGAAILPFIPTWNKEIITELSERLDKDKNPKTRMPNICVIGGIVQGVNRLLDEHDVKSVNFPDYSLIFAGEICKIIADPKPIHFQRYCLEMGKLLFTMEELKKKHGEDVFETAGFDQIVSRLIYLMKYESSVVDPTYYALWVQDFTAESEDVLSTETPKISEVGW